MTKLSTKTLLIILFFLLIPIVLLLRINQKPQTAEAGWWNDSWTYRKAINIGWTGTELTDFQVSFDIGTSTLVNAGKMQSDCDDIRITDHHGNLIPHWIEENNPGCNAASDTKIWLKAPTIPTGGATIYIYYGNSSASNIENGDNVFELFDDFNDGDASGWTISSGTWSVVNGEYYQSSDTGTYLVTSVGTGWTNTVTETRIKIASGGSTGGFASVLTRFQDYQNYYAFILDDRDDDSFWIRKWVNNVQTNWLEDTSITIDRDTWYNVGVSTINEGTDDTRIKIYIDGDYKNQQVDSPDSFDYGGIGLMVHGTQAYYDNVRVRKAVTSDPTTAAQSEETGTAPIAYWKFDEGVGTTAHDSAGANNGVITSATWQSEDQCISGKCLYFNGTNNNINFGNTTNLNNIGTQDFTISAWVKFSSFQNYNGVFTNKIITDNSTGIAIYSLSDGRLSAKLGNDSTNTTSTISVDKITTNQWYFITYARNGDHQYLYLDAKLEDDDSTGTIYNITNTNNCYISSNSYDHTGFIDEVKIYPYARTPDQILADYNLGASALIGSKSVESSGGLSDGLVGYWKLDETTSPSTDYSGRGYNATWTGNATSSSGKFGLGIEQTDGGGGYLSVGDTGDPFDMGTNNFSLAMWLKLDSLSSPNAPELLSKRDGGSFCAGSKGYHLRISYSNEVEFYVEGENDCQEINSASNAITTDTWYHVIAVYDQQNGSKIYINGQQSGNTVALTAGSTNNAGPLRIGMGVNGWEMDGKYDEVRIYNRALSASEVKDLYEWAPGPVLHLKLDENQGSTTYDSSGNSNNATLGSGTSAPIWSPGKFGSALSFDGTNDYVSLGNPASGILNFGTNDFTLATWVYLPTIPSAWKGLINKGGSGADGYGLSIDNTGKLNADIDAIGGTNQHVAAPSALTIGWHHAAAVFDRDDKIYLYIDGIGVTSSTYGTGNTSSIDNSNNFTLGSYYTLLSSPNWFFNGKLDDIRVYNYARTQQQILQDMWGDDPSASGQSGPLHPIAHWSFDEGHSTTAHDQIGTNHGTLNSVTWTNNGKIGRAVSFSGGIQSINITNNDSLKTPDALTISIWAKPDDMSAVGLKVAVDKLHTFELDKSANSNKMKFYIGNGSSWTDSIETLSDPTIGDWNNFVGTYDGTSLKIYLNGKLNNGKTTSAEYNTNDNNIGIGNLPSGNATYSYSGLIDEVKIYNYALSADEVALDYNQGQTAVMGSFSSNTGNTSPAMAGSQIYCVPGDPTACAPPVAEWNFNEGVGTTAYDTSGNSNHGVFGAGSSAPTWTTGKTGHGLSFINNNNYVRIPPSNSINNFWTNGGTIEFWMKENIISDGGTIISKYNWNDSAGWLFRFNGTTTRMYTQVFYSLNEVTNYGDTPRDNQWHYHNFIFDRSANKLLFYVDGALVHTSSGDLTSVADDSSLYLYIGKNLNITSSSYPSLSGIIDDVRIYNYARSPAQIAWDYNQGAPVAHWKLNECQGATVHSTNETYTSSLNGTINASTIGTCTSSGAWYDGRTGKIGASLYLDGDADYVTIGDIGTSATALSFWIKPDSTTQSIIELSSGNSVAISSGTVSVTGFGTETVYVDGRPSTTVSDTNWHHITIVSSANVAANTVNIGKISSTYYAGQIDDVQIFNYALTSEQIKTLYNSGSVSFTE